MARRPNQSAQINEALKFLQKIPPKYLIPLVLLVVVAAAAYFLLNRPAKNPAEESGPAGSFLFCSWNVENFYDDQDDNKNDDKLEDWFARNPDMFRLKTARLADALLKMNGGRGPDIMALYEVENGNCMNALKSALNERLEQAGQADAKYLHVLFELDVTGRRFAPGILTRLPVVADRTFKFAKSPNGRTLEGHLKVNGHELIVLAAHWTSRVDSFGSKSSADEPANARRRMSYAQDCYGRFRAIVTDNADAEVILCGDFNDEFKDPSIRDGLHASSSIDEARNAVAPPRPFALFANWPINGDPLGTIEYRGRWSIFDHILTSRGLLDDKGWSCDPTSAGIFAAPEMRRAGKGKGAPFRFGDERDTERGYADHFPVTVRLKVEGSEGK